MYCKRCGKFIDYQAEICNECAAAQRVAPASVQTQAPVEQGSAVTGIGKGITSVVLGSFGQFFVGILIGLLSESLYYADGPMVVLSMTIIGLSIPALILGISAMKTFFAEKSAGRKKPIVTLILGIYGLATSAIVLMIGALLFLAVLANAM